MYQLKLYSEQHKNNRLFKSNPA